MIVQLVNSIIGLHMGKITVFLAEDHSVVREGLVELIRREVDMEVVGEAGDGEDTIRQVQQLKPDIVLMDIAMPGVNGVEATKRSPNPCAGFNCL